MHSAMTETADSRHGITVLGSTGSIGRQTLDVVRAFPEHFQVVALAARGNVALLAEQAREFAPELVAYTSDDACDAARSRRAAAPALHGVEGLTAAATHPDAETRRRRDLRPDRRCGRRSPPSARARRSRWPTKRRWSWPATS